MYGWSSQLVKRADPFNHGLNTTRGPHTHQQAHFEDSTFNILLKKHSIRPQLLTPEP